MADKEERIYIKIFKKDVCKDCCDTKYCKAHNIECDCKIDYNEALTRKEAIEVMAKAICWEREHYPFEELPQYAIDSYIKQAQSALNALLGEGKLRHFLKLRLDKHAHKTNERFNDTKRL